MKRVLIVDDAIELGRLLQEMLRTVYPDIPVTVVPSAEEALLESARYTLDLLITDIRLPGMSGMELIRKIRNRQPNLKIILISGMIMDESMRKQRDEIKPNAFLPKPIVPQTFLDVVDDLLGEGRPPAAEVVAKKDTARLAPPSTNGEKDDVLKELASVLPGEPVEPKKSTGKLTQPPAGEPAAAEVSFSGVLVGLRSSLGALCASLLDERGHPVAQAGEMPVPALLTQLAPSLLAAVSAGTKVSYLLGEQNARLVQGYRGAEIDLVAAPVGQYTLMVALKPGRSSVRLAVTFDEVLNAQAELFGVMEHMGLRIQTATEAGAPETLISESSQAEEEVIPPEILETPLGQDQALEKFEELFVQKKTGRLQMQDPDAFWDAAPGEEQKEVTTPGVLTYEQAQKLGLFPSEKGE